MESKIKVGDLVQYLTYNSSKIETGIVIEIKKTGCCKGAYVVYPNTQHYYLEDWLRKC